jgi:biopolymer transport protein ExbB
LQHEAQYALMELFRDGGIMMYFLVLSSLLALGVMIAKAYILLIAHLHSKRLLREIAEMTGSVNRVESAIELADETEGPVAAIMSSGLRRVRERGHSDKDIEKAVATTGSIELGFLERGLVVLATVANVAPMMGFLGTVAGMIVAFGAVAEAGQIEASLVAGGIKVALITTATGLTIAIPVNIAYNFFVTRIDQLIIDMERGAEAVLDMAPPEPVGSAS